MRQKIWRAGAALILVLALGLSLAACSDDGNSSSDSTLTETASVPGESSGLTDEGSASSGADLAETGSQEPQVRMMTVDETINFFMKLDPSVLGLPGDSMEGYEVYPTEKAVPVDGLPCMKLTVYDDDGKAGTNSPKGTFLMSRDGARLYRLEGEEAIPIEWE